MQWRWRSIPQRVMCLLSCHPHADQPWRIYCKSSDLTVYNRWDAIQVTSEIRACHWPPARAAQDHPATGPLQPGSNQLRKPRLDGLFRLARPGHTQLPCQLRSQDVRATLGWCDALISCPQKGVLCILAAVHHPSKSTKSVVQNVQGKNQSYGTSKTVHIKLSDTRTTRKT